MAKCFALIRLDDTGPSIIPDLPYAQMVGEVFNYTLCDRLPSTNWGAYLCSARGAVLTQLDALSARFIGIVAVTSTGVVWGELENPCDSIVRNRLNVWLAAHNQPTIPEDWTNRQVVRAIFRRANQAFDFRGIDIMEWDA